MTTPFNSLNSQGKDSYTSTQIEIVLQFLKNKPATASMIAKATGIPHKNICRYKFKLEELGQLKQLKQGICKVTGKKAWFLTTDPELLDKSNYKGDNSCQLCMTM